MFSKTRLGLPMLGTIATAAHAMQRNRCVRALRFGIATLLVVTSWGATAAGASPAASSTPLPYLSGPLPVTAASYPWGAADHSAQPFDLAVPGYAESEYLVSGTANVYTWSSSNTAVVQSANAPFTTRILVRRPTNPTRFSGNVIVELLNPSYGYDLDFMWAADHEYFMARGDAWVGITVRPSSISSLKQFDPQRYASLSMANPQPASTSCATPAEMGTPATENGLALDIVSQVGALFHTSSPSSPLAGLAVKQVYATGYSTSANILQIYINAISKSASQPDGSPIYNGYVVGAPAGGVGGSLNQCSAWIAPGDPRIIIQPNRVPIIRVNTMSDFGWFFAGPPGTGIPAASTLNRRPDADAPNDRFREYEVPGATHLWTYLTPFVPGAAEAARVGAVPLAYPYPQAPGNNFPLQYVLDGAFQNLDHWARQGTPPPRADRIALNNAGTYSETTVLDQYGNPGGGLRTPYVDLPTQTYAWYSPCSGCGTWGHTTPLPKATTAALYAYPLAYDSSIIDATFTLVAANWIPEMDGRKIILEAIQSTLP